MLVNKRHRQKETQLFFMTIRKIEKTLTIDATHDINSMKMFMKNVKTRLLLKYRDLKKAFNQSQAKKLSSHRLYDVKIELKRDRSQLSRSRIYFISKHKLQKLKQYLNKNLKKDFISVSHASFESSVLFALKANENLRVCVDYRKLNVIIKRN